MMKIYISKITLILFLLFVGIVKTNAAYNGDCLLDVFQSELKEKNSKDIHDYFLNKSEEDSNNAYQAWKVLYEADTSVDRLDTNNLEELIGYIKRSENELDAIIKKIKDAGGYVPFKSTPSWFVSFVDEPYKKAFKADIEASKELVRSFNVTTDLIKSWQLLHDLNVSDQFRRESMNIYATNTYINKIQDLGYEVNSKLFNDYVKHALDRDGYMKSILFHDKLYGGIKISSELLNDIKPISKKDDPLKLTQYLGIKNAGSFEIRINGGKIERYLVDDAGVGSWKGLNGTDEVDFVITNDGILRLGYGHYMISGKATQVISAGTLVIKDGKVAILKNWSGDYQPDADNLYGAERIFKELGVTSNDFKLDFHKGTIITERPVVNNTNAQIDELVAYTDEVYKAVLKEDLEASEELVKLFHKKPDLIKSWELLHDLKLSDKFRQEAKNVDALNTYFNKIHIASKEVSLESFNDFVKSTLNRDAYVKSILFPEELYGGVKVPQQLLSGINPLTVKTGLSTESLQQTATRVSQSNEYYFGAYEIRINSNKIQRYYVNESGFDSWENMYMANSNVMSYVITMDGRLRIGIGQYNLSGQANQVLSSGHISIENGKVVEIIKSSDIYNTSEENLLSAKKIFKTLGVTSDKLELYFAPEVGHINNISSTKYQLGDLTYTTGTKLYNRGQIVKEHFFYKGKEQVAQCGHSTISTDGLLDNFLDIKYLESIGGLKLVLDEVVTSDIQLVRGQFSGSNDMSYEIFKEHNKGSKEPKDIINAILQTPEGIYYSKDWNIIGVNVDDKGVYFYWERKNI